MRGVYEFLHDVHVHVGDVGDDCDDYDDDDVVHRFVLGLITIRNERKADLQIQKFRLLFV